MPRTLTAILNASWRSGLSLTAEVFFGGTLVDSIEMEEVGSTAVYNASFEPAQTGEYSWRAVDSDGNTVWTDEFSTVVAPVIVEPGPEPEEPETVTDAIEQAAKDGIQSTTSDGQSVTRMTVSEQIAADRYATEKRGAGNPFAAIRRARNIPPGSI